MCPSIPYMYDVIIYPLAAAPVMTHSPSSMGVEVLTNATVPCAGTGKPPPQVIWSRTNREIVNMTGRFSQLRGGALRIHRKSIYYLFNNI